MKIEITDKQREILEYIVHTDNPLMFRIYHLHGKELYKYSDDVGYHLDIDDKKIINLLFDIVKGLDASYKHLLKEYVNYRNSELDPLIIHGDTVLKVKHSFRTKD